MYGNINAKLEDPNVQFQAELALTSEILEDWFPGADLVDLDMFLVSKM